MGNKKFHNCLPFLNAFEACDLPFPASYFSENDRLTNPVTGGKEFIMELHKRTVHFLNL